MGWIGVKKVEELGWRRKIFETAIDFGRGMFYIIGVLITEIILKSRAAGINPLSSASSVIRFCRGAAPFILNMVQRFSIQKTLKSAAAVNRGGYTRPRFEGAMDSPNNPSNRSGIYPQGYSGNSVISLSFAWGAL